MSSGKLELKITEDSKHQPVHLADMSLRESKSLITLLEALTNIIEQSTDSKDIRVQVVEGSIAVVADAPVNVITEIRTGFEDVVNGKSANSDLVEGWRKIQDLFWANGLHYQATFQQGEQRDSILDDIKKSRKFRTKSVRKKAEFDLKFIEGQLIEIGGKKPNIHIIDKNNDKITINCTEAEARKVNSLLYQPVKLSVWSKTTSTPNYIFCDNYINDAIFTEFKEFILSENDYDKYLNDLHYKIKGLLDNKDYGILAKFLRLFNHASVENSTLKTILIITKSFRETTEIKSIRLTLKELLEKKQGRKLI